MNFWIGNKEDREALENLTARVNITSLLEDLVSEAYRIGRTAQWKEFEKERQALDAFLKKRDEEDKSGATDTCEGR